RDANLVHAWIERCSDAETDSPSPYVIRLINGTSSPIFDILVSVCINEQFSDAPGQDKTWTMLPPGKFEVRKHRKFPWAFPFDDCDSNHAPQFKNQHFRVTALRFTDAAGVQWIRENASLREA
ncbi:MAG: hypothetical protein FWG11_07130, partial [Promicromonosporaceae bacterium]|nr:hypothetical protein [Promicromonosporaceae bacterium]